MAVHGCSLWLLWTAAGQKQAEWLTVEWVGSCAVIPAIVGSGPSAMYAVRHSEIDRWRPVLCSSVLFCVWPVLIPRCIRLQSQTFLCPIIHCPVPSTAQCSQSSAVDVFRCYCNWKPF